MPEPKVPNYERNAKVVKQRAKRSGRRDPYMAVILTRDTFEFYHGIQGPNGNVYRYALPIATAYAFFKRQLAKLEQVYKYRGEPVPDVPLDDIDAFVREVYDVETDGGAKKCLTMI